MANEIQDTILKGVFEGNKTRFFYLVEKTRDEYFSEEYRDLWVIAQRVHDVSREIMDHKTLEKVLSRSSLPIERVAKVEDLWRRLSERPDVSEVDFKASVDLLLKDYQTVKLGEALATSLEILSRGVLNEKTKVFMEGPTAALEHFRHSLGEVESINLEVLPEFNIRKQKLELLAELVEVNSMDRLATGIRPLDDMTGGGIALGEVMLIVAGTGVGKSISCTSIAEDVVAGGHNVVLFTSETLFKQIRHRVLIKHTRREQFGVPGGLSSTLVRKHTAEEPTLSEEDQEAYRAAVINFSDNPDYGQLIVCQIPKGTTMSTLEAKLYRWEQEFPIHLCIIDSPDMLAPDYRFSEERHNLNDIVNAVAGLAISFNGGKGLRLLCPWQASRKGQVDARETGRYTKDCLSDTQMAEKRAAIIMALLEDPDVPTRIKAQILKCRDAAPVDFILTSELDNYYIGSDESLDEGGSGIDVARLL